MKLRITHLHLPAADGPKPHADAIAQDDTTGERWFVPGFLPCGDCDACARARTAICPFGTTPLDGAVVGAVIDVADRFVYAVGAADLDDPTAATAGEVALALESLSRAGVGAGDDCFWVGTDSIAQWGLRLCAARGAMTPETPSAQPLSRHGRRDRKLFFTNADAATVAAQLALQLSPGATVTFLGRPNFGLPALADFALCRIHVVPDFHPDFVPEALAALRALGSTAANTTAA